ncbi:MAG: 2OG-Fe(II) oxygenase [Betaproteobacteria bacterium]|nr:2OG-Fe(II) oxygenase [Betaproteobacteria bacterium]
MTPLAPGEPAPWFTCRTRRNEHYAFDTVAGRHVVLCFFGSAAHPAAARVLSEVARHRSRFDDRDVCFFGVSVDPEDETGERVSDAIPGIRYFWDFDRSVSALYGAARGNDVYQPLTYLLDPALRILAVLPVCAAGEGHVPALLELLDRLPAIPPPHPAAAQAPVLVLPRVFEPELCRALVNHYIARGGEDSGFMRDIGGKTVPIIEYGHKRRRDCAIADEELRRACAVRIYHRVVPETEKAFQFRATRMERYILACYDSAEGGHFRPHRDNTTKGTAHRRFAVSLFLNTGEYTGGYLRFPEFGSALYTAPVGGAVVFSCSLLHEATAVTRGRRYMFLPFLYDEAARRIREENSRFLESGRRDV